MSPVHAALFEAVQATHVFVVGEHAGVAPLQSASIEHASHFPALGPVVAQAPERHADALCPPSALAHAPPSGIPHSPSVVSHTPATHARTARAGVHEPPGTAPPFATWAWHTPTPASPRLSHQWPAPQIASVVHVEPHAPVAMSQRGPA